MRIQHDTSAGGGGKLEEAGQNRSGGRKKRKKMHGGLRREDVDILTIDDGDLLMKVDGLSCLP
jgi:hypothetical protein